jgi:Domain of unknown function (DUF222)
MNVVGVVTRICTADITGADRDAVEAVMADIAQVRRWLDGVEVACARRLDRLADSTPSMLPPSITANANRRGIRHGTRVHERAATAAAVPELGAALDAGDVSGEHVDAMTGAMKGLAPEHREELAARGGRLAAIAAQSTPEQFQRTVAAEARSIEADDGIARLQRQKRDVRLRCWTDKDSGMIRLSGWFDPESGLPLLGRLDNQVDAMFHAKTPDDCPADPIERQEFLRAHALLALTNGTGVRSGRPEVIITIDLETIINGRHDGSRVDLGADDVDLPVDTIRRIASFADIVPVVIDHAGVVLKLGRTVRFANRDQRRAIRAMYRRCVVPDCPVHVKRCEPHHIIHWEDGGPTDLDLLVPVCKHHHDIAHAQGWIFKLAADRSLTITFADGTTMTTGPPADQWR